MKNKETLDFKHYAAELTCLGRNKVEYVGYALIDHHIPLLPEKLILFIADHLTKYFFNMMLKDLKSFEKTVWAKEMKENY